MQPHHSARLGPSLTQHAEMSEVCRQEASPLVLIVHALDGRDHVGGPPHGIIRVGETPKVPIRVVRIETHRLFQKLDRLLWLPRIDERVRIFGDDIAVIGV